MKISTKIFLTGESVNLRFTRLVKRCTGVLFIMMCSTLFTSAQILGWQFGSPASTGSEVTYTATTIAPNLNSSVLSRGTLTASALARSYSSTNYTASGTKADALATNKYMQVTVSASAGFKVSLSTLDARLRRSSTGPNAYIWRYSTDGTSFTDIGSDISFTSTADGVDQSQLNLSGIPALQNVLSGTTITLRIYAWGASATGGTFAIGRFAAAATNNSLAIGGTVVSSATAPTVSTTTVSAITTSGATSGGNVSSDGGSAVTARGVAYGTTANPTTAGLNTSDGTGTGSFSSTLSSLGVNTLYFYRAYATNTSGTSYGNESSFYTLANTPNAPVVNGATAGSLNVAIGSGDGNPAATVYAIQETGSGNYVQANGTLGATAVFQTAATWGTITVTGLTASTSYTFQVKGRNGAGTETAFGTTASGTTLAAAAPVLAASAPTGFGAVCINTTSSSHTFTITGSNLTAANVTVATLNGFTYSTNDGTYTSSLSLTQPGGSYSQLIYVRFSPTAVQSYDGSITVGGGGAPNYLVTVTGSGINTAPSVTTGGSSAVTQFSATLNGTVSADGCTAVSAYGIEYSTTNNFPNGTGTPAPGNNINAGAFSVSVSGLNAGVTYYYKAYATNAGGTTYGAQQSFSTPALDAPVATAASGITANSFTANWNAVAGAASYRLDVSTSPTFTTSNATDLFISEYVEGSSNNKYVEIYNGTGAAVNLANYQLQVFANGSPTVTTTGALSGTLPNGNTIVYKNSAATVYAGAATVNSATNYNGNDAVALYKVSTASFVDIFGRIGENPGAAWTSGAFTTVDKTLVRNSNVSGGVTVNPTAGFPTLSTQWTQSNVDVVTNLGSHTYSVSNPSFVPGYNDLTVNGISQSVTGLTPLTNYYYRVRAFTATSTSANSNVINVQTICNSTITATSGTNGSVTPAGASTPNCGDNLTYTITPDACYSIASVLVDGISVGAVGTYTFTNVQANHTISATFVQTTYTITATSGANGSVTPAGASTVNCGDNATYTITPNACYAVADVLVDGSSVGAVPTYTFNTVGANHTISATFVLTTYTITATSGANGSVTPAGATTVNCGDNATYTITPNACYAIADVLVDGSSVGAVPTYTFNTVGANHTISATFVLTTYTITATSGANGSVTPAGASTVNCGDNATYTITPDACYAIADVLVDGTSVGAVPTYTFNTVGANHTISATFVLTTYTITATSGANGSVTPAGASTVNCGDNATYTITPNACYAITDVLVDGSSVGAVPTYTFNTVGANHTISATFVQTTYTITATSGANGSVTPAGASTVNCGDNATYTITPNACYAIANVLVDGSSVGAVPTYTFNTVAANHTISATFVQTTYTITVTAGANGSITPGTGSVNCGDNATYTITANACYAIADVVVDGVSQGATGTYTFTNVQANHTISATFVQTTYTITATSGANGSVTPAGTSTVNCGSSPVYTISPNAGYAIQDVLVDGSSVGPVASYTFTNIAANHTISATFVANASFTITASAGANGTIAPNGVTNVAPGGSQSYTITSATCYHVQDVLVDGSSVGAVTTYTFTNVTANHTISASFAINAPLANPVVTGPVNVCVYIGTGAQVTYTASSAGATGYTWVLPPANVTIVSGQGTANLTVTFQTGFAAQPNKQLKVTATSSCGNSGQVIYYLAAQSPPTPQPITGNSNVCPIIGTGNTYTYYIHPVAGATSYSWSAQAGTTSISDANGGPAPTDTAVKVSFTNAFTTSTISVSATNGCGTSGVRTFTINKVNPSTPGPIAGSTDACPYMAPNGTAATYSVTPVANAASYTWTPPSGATVLTGQGTATITVSYPSTFVSGTLSVTASNGCGTSAARNLSINKLNPSAPGNIDIIQTGSCPDRTFTYSIATMPAHSTSVQWTVPAGATIVSGQGTTSIMVSYPATSVNGTVTVQAFNNCGSSSIKSTTVKLPTCVIERPSFTKSRGGSTMDGIEIKVFPNPSVSDFKLQVLTAGKEQINVKISDMQGRELKQFTITPYQTVNAGAELKAGAYIMEVRQGSEVKTSKLIKF